jgi:hypothetical protein
MFGWYLTLAIMLAVVDFPLLLPVGDFSTVIKAKTELDARKATKKKDQESPDVVLNNERLGDNVL